MKKKNGKFIAVISSQDKAAKDKAAKDRNYIYTITCLYDIPPYCHEYKSKAAYTRAYKKYKSHGGNRTFGWFTSLKKAKEAVENNYADIHEYSYLYVIIEKTKEGVYGGFELPKEYWYKWDGSHDGGKYVPIEKPDELKRVVCWGFG